MSAKGEPSLAALVHARDGFQSRVHPEFAEDILDVVSHRGLADVELFRDCRRGCASPHETQDLELALGQFTTEGDSFIARGEFLLSQLLANEHVDLVGDSDIAEEVDDTRRTAVAGWNIENTHVEPHRGSGPGPGGHVEMLDRLPSVQKRLDGARRPADPIAVAVAAGKELAAQLPDGLLSGIIQDGFGGPVPAHNPLVRPSCTHAICRIRKKRKKICSPFHSVHLRSTATPLNSQMPLTVRLTSDYRPLIESNRNWRRWPGIGSRVVRG